MDPTVRSVLRWTLLALAVAFVVLLGTGLWLIANYRPTDGLTYVPNAYPGPSIAWIHRVTVWHRWTSTIAVTLAIAVFVEAVVGAATVRRWRGAVVGLAAPVLAIAVAVSGYRIAWDRLGLYEVTIGKNMMGYHGVFDDQLRFVVVGSRRVPADTYHRWYWAHVAVIPALILVTAVTVLALTRRARAAIASPAVPDIDVIRE